MSRPRLSGALKRHDLEAAIEAYESAMAAIDFPPARVACKTMLAALREDLAVWHALRSGARHPAETLQRSAMVAYMSVADSAFLAASEAPEPSMATLMRSCHTAALLRMAVYAGAVRDIEAMTAASQGIIDAADASVSDEDLAGAHTQLGIALSTQGVCVCVWMRECVCKGGVGASCDCACGTACMYRQLARKCVASRAGARLPHNCARPTTRGPWRTGPTRLFGGGAAVAAVGALC